MLRFGHENFNFINFNLEDSRYLDRIQEVKKSKPKLYIESISWSTRCVEIMWGKFDWLLHVIDKIGVAENKYVYWIDGGLSHEGVIPVRFNSRKAGVNFQNQSHQYSHMFSNDLIFNPDFPDFLVEYGGAGNLLHFLCNHPQHSDASHLQLRNPHVGTAVGGLFGGDITLMRKWAVDGMAICDELLDGGYISKEEDILTHLLNVNSAEDSPIKDRLTMFRFDTWYHEDWDVYDPKQKSFAAFFDEFQEYRKNK
jgi:hypothetical protein